jgi:YD repeat-containing protein
MTLADGSYWLYFYDDKGQVIFGKRYWQDNTPVAAQQNEYAFDDIGNRTSTKAGGDSNGANLRSATYTANSLNQYTNRTVPGAVDILGIANSAATVTVNANTAYRKGEYFDYALGVANSSAAVWQAVSVIAANGGSSTTNSGSVFLPQTPEAPTYDLDGNTLTDGRWTYTWDAENRLTQMQSLGTTPQASWRKVVFEYDAQGRRIRKLSYDGSSGTYVLTVETRFLYDGWNLPAELNGSNALVRAYLWGSDLSGGLQGAGGVGGLIAMKPSGGAAHFAAYDGNGNVVALVDGSAGTASANYEYGVFGETIRATGTQERGLFLIMAY